MKAVVWTQYGPPDVLQLREVKKPTPEGDEILIRVNATTVTTGDCELRGLKLPIYLSLPMRIWLGFQRPRDGMIPGTDLAGVVEATGKEVKTFKEGDQVFGTTGLDFGAYAEYKCMPEKPEAGALAIKPANMSYEEAAAVPFGGLEALHFIRKGNIQNGQRVLINGAGGSIGTFAVQLARFFGAVVTAVDSTSKLTLLSSIGADTVIDYTLEDYTKNDQSYDVIFDTVGKSSFSGSIRSLKKSGIYLSANPGLTDRARGLWVSLNSSKKVFIAAASYKTEDLIFLKELVEAGKIKSVIDRQYPLEQIVDAHRYVETGQKKGNVVITVN